MVWKRATSSFAEAGVRAGWLGAVMGLRGFECIAAMDSGMRMARRMARLPYAVEKAPGEPGVCGLDS